MRRSLSIGQSWIGLRFLSVALQAVLCCGALNAAETEEIPAGYSDQGAESESDLAKKAQNPVSDLISLPLQNNFDFGIGPKNGVRYTLNIQPIYPAKLGDNWNLINRPIVPLKYEPSWHQALVMCSVWVTLIIKGTSLHETPGKLSGVPAL